MIKFDLAPFARYFPLSDSLSAQLPVWLLAGSTLVVTLMVLYSFLSIRWQRLRDYPFTLHVFFLWSLALCLFSMGRTGVLPGLSFHVLALTAATLMMSWRLAFLAALFTQIMLWICGFEALAMLGVNSLFSGLLPIAVAQGFCTLLQRFLPKNPFIFTIGCGFFGGIFTMAITMSILALLYYLLGLYPWEMVWDKYLKFLPVIIYPEGFINGVILTGMVAFHPRAISAFDPDSYFINRP